MPRPTCGCSASSPAAGCWPAWRWPPGTSSTPAPATPPTCRPRSPRPASSPSSTCPAWPAWCGAVTAGPDDLYEVDADRPRLGLSPHRPGPPPPSGVVPASPRPVASPPHARPRLHRRHRCAPRRAREGAARAAGLRGALPVRRPARRPDLGDQLRPARRGARRPGSGPTSPSSGPRGPRPPTAPGTSRRSSPSRHGSTSRWCCASSGWSRPPDPRRCSTPCPRRARPSAASACTGPAPRSRRSPTRTSTETEHAIEVSYEGSYELDEATLADGSILDDHFSAMGGWISSTLVRLGDLKFEFLPPLEKDED